MTPPDRAGPRRPAFTVEDLAYVLFPVVPFRLMCAAARAQGRLHHRLRADRRATVRANLEVAFGAERPAAELDRLARQAFEHRQLRGLLVTLSPRIDERRAARLFPMEGLEHLDRARSGGKGLVLVTSHLNSICTFIAIERLRAGGYDLRLTLPTREEPYPLSRFRRALYRRTGGRTFVERTAAFYAQFNLRPIVRALRAGAGVIIVGDGWHSAGFVRTTLLGRPVHVTTGAMSVGRLADVPVVPMFCVGDPPDGLRFRFEAPIHADPSVETHTDVERMVLEYVERLDRHIRQSPSAWQHWFEPDALATMLTWPERTLEDRYRIGGAADAPAER